MRLFKYWLDRTLTRRGSSPASFISLTARCDAAWASSVILVAPVLHCIAEKGLGSVDIPVSAQEEIDGPAGPVHGPIQVDPEALGVGTFDLLAAARFQPESHQGQKVEARGLLYRDSGRNLLNLTSLGSMGTDCPK